MTSLIEKPCYSDPRPIALKNYKRGELHHGHTFTQEIVRKMRRDRLKGMSYSDLARKYKTVISNAWKICNNKGWRHVR